MTSTADAEIVALYINLQKEIPMLMTIEDMGHKQPPTPTQIDNTTSLGFITKELHPESTNSTDMKHWFVRDPNYRSQLKYYWGSGKYNDNEYHSNCFCSVHHRKKRPRYLTPRLALDALRAFLGKSPHIF